MAFYAEVIAVLSHPLTGASITFVAAVVAFCVGRLRPEDRTWWQEAKEWPGKVVLGATLVPNLAAALPGAVYELPTASCDPLPCHSVGGGYRVVEGTGFGSFLGQLVLGALVDVPVGVAGSALGVAVATTILRARTVPPAFVPTPAAAPAAAPAAGLVTGLLAQAAPSEALQLVSINGKTAHLRDDRGRSLCGRNMSHYPSSSSEVRLCTTCSLRR
ncbi:MAG: hypothetical protein ABIQ13_09940 [Pedococcus sp.]